MNENMQSSLKEAIAKASITNFIKNKVVHHFSQSIGTIGGVTDTKFKTSSQFRVELGSEQSVIICEYCNYQFKNEFSIQKELCFAYTVHFDDKLLLITNQQNDVVQLINAMNIIYGEYL